MATPKPATGIFNKSELTLTVGAVDDSLKATVTPADFTDMRRSSDKPAVATVDPATGSVTAVAPVKIARKRGEQNGRPSQGDGKTVVTNSSPSFPGEGIELHREGLGSPVYRSAISAASCLMSDNPLTGIPYRATNDDHDFNTSEWG